MKVTALIADFFSLLFPKLCINCQLVLSNQENHLCISCMTRLPTIKATSSAANAIERLFYDQELICKALCLYRYQKKGVIQHLVHELKYKGNKDVGEFFGRQLAIKINEWLDTGTEDYCIVPVPLHWKRKKQRGYNQSEVIAKEISGQTSIEMINAIKKTNNTAPQTTKSKYLRWDNIDTLFVSNKDLDLSGKHIILVDDIITTGATITKCVQALQHIDGIKISVVSVAYS